MVRKYTDALVHLHRVNTTCLAENIAYLILVRNSDIFLANFFRFATFFRDPPCHQAGSSIEIFS